MKLNQLDNNKKNEIIASLKETIIATGNEIKKESFKDKKGKINFILFKKKKFHQEFLISRLAEHIIFYLTCYNFMKEASKDKGSTNHLFYVYCESLLNTKGIALRKELGIYAIDSNVKIQYKVPLRQEKKNKGKIDKLQKKCLARLKKEKNRIEGL